MALGHFLGMSLVVIDSVTADAGGQVGEILLNACRTNQGGSWASSGAGANILGLPSGKRT